VSGAPDSDVDDNGGAHVHGAVNDDVSVDLDPFRAQEITGGPAGWTVSALEGREAQQ
jgi:hypothetical protein